MLTDPTIWVECNFCEGAEEIPLTACAKGTYDERNVNIVLATWGWVEVEENVHKCPFCIAEER